MARRVALRILYSLVTIFGVIIVTFLLEFVVPGDPARVLAPEAHNALVLEGIRHQLHLNDPLWLQFVRYIGQLLQGNLGTSYVQREAVTTLLLRRLPATAILALAGVACEVAIGGTLGVWSAIKPRFGPVTTGANMLLLSIPEFAIGLLLLLFFGFDLGLLPVTGGSGPLQLILPAVTLGLVGAPWYAQLTRAQMAEALSSSYVRSAVSKGLPDRVIVLRHALRNVYSPIATMMGMDLGHYLSGVVVVEAVFGWPGIGELAVQSLANLDRPVVLGTVLLGATAVVVFNLLTDFARMYLDPRTRAAAA